MHPAFTLLIALAAVIIVGRMMGRLFALIGQPPVIGQVLAGILLGPSFVGSVAPGVYRVLFPADVVPLLDVVAQAGVLLYMFLVGLELDAGQLRGRVRATVLISQAGIVVPFALGAALAIYLYPRFSASDVPFASFALFLGVAMSITAFPVLARILAEAHMTRTDLGVIALTVAAVGDVTAWCLLAFVVGVIHAEAQNALIVALLTVGFIGLMFGGVRPIVARLVRGTEERAPTMAAMALTLVGMLLSAWATHAIGVHALFGAFLFGAVVPHESGLARRLTASLESPVTVLLLPAFFAFAGMRTEIGLLSGVSDWLVCGAIVLVATAGKVGGTFVSARIAGLARRQAAALAVLMNTRGLMELVVLNVGLQLGVISPALFTMMVIMALVTTVATTPVLRWLAVDGSLTSARS